MLASNHWPQAPSPKPQKLKTENSKPSPLPSWPCEASAVSVYSRPAVTTGGRTCAEWRAAKVGRPDSVEGGGRTGRVTQPRSDRPAVAIESRVVIFRKRLNRPPQRFVGRVRPVPRKRIRTIALPSANRRGALSPFPRTRPRMSREDDSEMQQKWIGGRHWWRKVRMQFRSSSTRYCHSTKVA